MSAAIVLLNYDFTIINNIDVKKFAKLLIKGKAHVLNDRNDKDLSEHIKDCVVYMKPKIVRMLYQISDIASRHIKYNRQRVFLRDKYTCQYCGAKPSKLTIDHVMPESRGGKTTYENCVTACFECNCFKDDRTPEEAGMKLRRKPFHPSIVDFFRIKFGNFDFEGIEINWA